MANTCAPSVCEWYHTRSPEENILGVKKEHDTLYHSGGVATGHTPTPSHFPATFREGGGGGGAGLEESGWLVGWLNDKAMVPCSGPSHGDLAKQTYAMLKEGRLRAFTSPLPLSSQWVQGVVHLLRPARLSGHPSWAPLHSCIWASSQRPSHYLPGRGATLCWVTGRVPAPLHPVTPRIQKAARGSNNSSCTACSLRSAAPLPRIHDYSSRVSNPCQRHPQPGR